MKLFLSTLIFLLSSAAQAQISGDYVWANKYNCNVFIPGYNSNDSTTAEWDGACKDEKAEGNGTIKFFQKGTLISSYTGYVQAGMPEGKGMYIFPGNITQEGSYHLGRLNGYGTTDFHDGVRKFSGTFKNGEFLDLGNIPADRIFRQPVPYADSTMIYAGGINKKELLYFCVLPDEKIKGVIVLLPGTWGRADYELSANKKLCETAYAKGIAVLLLSVNQRLTLNDDVRNFMNKALTDAVQRFQLPRDKFVIGGFSMGGLFAQRYTEMAYEDSTKTAIVPRAVYSVDGPADLESLYRVFQRKRDRNPAAAGEPLYGIRELEKYIGGSPDTLRERYASFSAFTHAAPDGGNAKYLKNIPVRIYNDVDVNWWLTNRGDDLYDMNALDQSAMINTLRRLGNTRAEFINAYGKGYRLEGNRHPHAWSIVDGEELVRWVEEAMR